MCLGIPLRVRTILSPVAALCTGEAEGAEPRPVDIALLDEPPGVGDWLLVHVNVAIRALAAGEARQIADALMAVQAAAAGEPFEHLLGDLIDREPELPAHLRQPRQPVTADE
jgi:hydrogenase expression/formation protein HypC